MQIVFVVLALAVALFIFVMGVWGTIAPGSIFAFISGWSSKLGFWLAVLLRLCFGLALWFAAPDTRLPILLRARAQLVDRPIAVRHAIVVTSRCFDRRRRPLVSDLAEDRQIFASQWERRLEVVGHAREIT